MSGGLVLNQYAVFFPLLLVFSMTIFRRILFDCNSTMYINHFFNSSSIFAL